MNKRNQRGDNRAMNRMRNIVYITILIILFPPLSILSSAEDSSTVVIKGRVLNKTIDGKGVKDIEVTLHRFTEEKNTEVSRTETDHNGNFLFKDITVDKNMTYFTSTKYKEVEYFSPEIKFEDKKVPTSELIVYETTDQNQNIHIKMHHIILEVNKDSLAVREIMIVENQGNRAYVGSQEVQPGNRETLRVSLPEGATNIESMGLLKAFKTENGFIDTMAIKPGIKRMAFTYTINLTETNYKFTKRVNLKTDNLDFIFPDSGVKVKSEHLELKEPVTNSDNRFLHLSGKNFTAGSRIIVDIIGLTRTGNLFKWVIIGLVAALIGTGFTLSFMKRGRDHEEDEQDDWTVEPDEINLTQQRQEVLQAIAELDDLSESGEIKPEEYQAERDQLLQKAIELTTIEG
jgi:5-hydroxyisourate hydrolase-like protein (transthyretin family)